MEESRTAQTSIGKLNLFLTGGGLLFFVIGSYMSLASISQSELLFPGQYFFGTGIILSFVGIISIFRRNDF
ncbi:MAG: hypothetical protein OK439_07480 [Thaumarchaeota archaeon]|nr:hypothetical protein [Nitrososphaerota archaeon]